MKQAGRGRPTGRSDARERILTAARARFLADGYQAVSMRSIAADAGVDVALVSYYFDSKQGVFGAALALPVNPLDKITGVLALPDEQIAAALLRTFLVVWDDPASGTPLRTIAAAAVGDPSLNRLVRELIEREILTLVAGRISRGGSAGSTAGAEDGRARAMAFATQMAGLIFTRYLIPVEPMASMSIDDVVARLTPVVNAALWPPTG
jgi:AcrR family transcriptional regulator